MFSLSTPAKAQSRSIATLAGVAVVACVFLAAAWYPYINAAHRGERFELEIALEVASRRDLLKRQARDIVARAGAEPSDDLLAQIQVALARPEIDGVAPAVPVAHVLFLSTPAVGSSLVQDISPLVSKARALLAHSEARQEQSLAAYRQALATPWSGFWLRMAGYPKLRTNVYLGFLCAS